MGTADNSHSHAPEGSRLQREIGLLGAMMMGLGSIVGTGIFVSIGIAAEVTGPSVVLAIAVAALLATFNGLSSAQLAAVHPVSGGTYEYGYRWLHPALGFTAGWMFLCAKSASAATAALGFASYALQFFGFHQSPWVVPVAAATVVLMTGIALTGIQRSNRANSIIVGITVGSLGCLIAAGLPTLWKNGTMHLEPFFQPVDGGPPVGGFFEACALMFVAMTGYGRIATLGEEVAHPQTTIPRAIILTLGLSSVLYMAVGLTGIASTGAEAMARATSQEAAPLEVVARTLGVPLIPQIVAMGATTAMLGVLLNLILGLSRVLLAMGRRGDMPPGLARINPSTRAPSLSVVAVGILIAALTLIGNVKTTWSFSAFTVLVYYALTNLAALRLSESERRYPRVIAWAGLAGCASLVFWVEPLIGALGLGLIGGGLIFQWAVQRLFRGERTVP